MPNIASNSLYQLIQSLTKAEKRYFKLFASRHTLGAKNNYLELFEAMEKLKTSDDQKIKERFHNRPFLKHYSIAKARLYDSILISLQQFHANSSIEAQIQSMLHSVEILYKKSLYKQCKKNIAKARKLAEKNEAVNYLPEIAKWEKWLLEKDNYLTTDEAGLNQHAEKEKANIQHILQHTDLWQIKSKLFVLLNKKGKARTAAELIAFEKIIESALPGIQESTLSVRNLYLYHHIFSAYYFATDNTKQCYQSLMRNKMVVEQNLKLFRDEPNIYFSILTNMIYCASQLKKFKDADALLLELRSLPEKLAINASEDLNIKLFSSSYSIELAMAATSGRFKKGLERLPVITEGLARYDGKINNVRKAFLYFSIATLYFGEEQYSKALTWINRLLNDIPIDKTEDIYCFGQLLNMLIHLELGNNALIPHTLRSTKRYLESRKRAYQFEASFMDFINKIARCKKDEELVAIYENLSKSLRSLSKNSFDNVAFEYFDFLSWAESKTRESSFKDIVQEKAAI